MRVRGPPSAQVDDGKGHQLNRDREGNVKPLGSAQDQDQDQDQDQPDVQINPDRTESEETAETFQLQPRSCKELKKDYGFTKDGIYTLVDNDDISYQTFCDMTTNEGGWTLVASIHENNIKGKCTIGDLWSSQRGNSSTSSTREGTWANHNTFGSTEGATSDDYKNPGYFHISAADVSVWHVPNNRPLESWRRSAILRYHTDNHFLHQYGGNLFHLFTRFPVEYMKGRCPDDNGPAIPIIHDTGNEENTANFYPPNIRDQVELGFVHFRVFNNEGGALAMCSGVKAIGCDTEQFCVGAGSYFPEDPGQCGDFSAFDRNGYGARKRLNASREMTESAILLFYQ
ncbi:intelectin-1b-like [Heptranchias perlo]|uniref:intelectin-1b-like n=1 Tax=Heptranchias perlo TaxID=212740 RepID=UPI00355A0AD7